MRGGLTCNKKEMSSWVHEYAANPYTENDLKLKGGGGGGGGGGCNVLNWVLESPWVLKATFQGFENQLKLHTGLQTCDCGTLKSTQVLWAGKVLHASFCAPHMKFLLYCWNHQGHGRRVHINTAKIGCYCYHHSTSSAHVWNACAYGMETWSRWTFT